MDQMLNFQSLWGILTELSIDVYLKCQTAVLLIFYGLQHFLSLAGSLIFIPLIMVPAMGGSDVRIPL